MAKLTKKQLRKIHAENPFRPKVKVTKSNESNLKKSEKTVLRRKFPFEMTSFDIKMGIVNTHFERKKK